MLNVRSAMVGLSLLFALPGLAWGHTAGERSATAGRSPLAARSASLPESSPQGMICYSDSYGGKYCLVQHWTYWEWQYYPKTQEGTALPAPRAGQ